MQSLFVTTATLHSERWRLAFPDADILDPSAAIALLARERRLVWLLLDGRWQSVLPAIHESASWLVAMSLDESFSEARWLLAEGARAYINALAAPEMLREVAEVVSRGNTWLAPNLLKALAQAASRPAGADNARTVVLTDRERAVAIAVASGQSNKEVARELQITERTVKAHLSACYEKLRVRDRTQLTRLMNGG